MIWKDLKASSQCVKIVKAANQIFGMIKRTFTCETKDNFTPVIQMLGSTALGILYAGVKPVFLKE